MNEATLYLLNEVSARQPMNPATLWTEIPLEESQSCSL